MKVSTETKKKEAIKRLKAIGIIQDTINQFTTYDVPSVSENPYGFIYWPSDTQRKLIKNFEQDYNSLVYLCNYCETEFGRLLNLFYVSDHESEWDMDNNDIKNGYAFVYCANLDVPEFSEFGSIAFEPVNGGVKRIG